jgi:hypothetical protein
MPQRRAYHGRLRWPGIEQGPPPPNTFFGPTVPVADVRAQAGARAVVDPGGGVPFTSSATLAAAIAANPSARLFVCTSSTPAITAPVQLDPGYTILFPGAVGSKIIDGAGRDIVPFELLPGALIKGGKIQNWGTTTHGTGIVLRGAAAEDVVVTDCFETGISLQTNSAGRISHCTLFDNGHNGYGSGTDDCILEFNNVYGNNTRLISPGNEGGAGKLLFAGHGLFKRNWVHGNLGFGAWWDTGNSDWIIEDNVCEDNSFAGIFYEANFGSEIRHNYIANNGRTGTIGGTAATIENCVNMRLSDNAADRVAPDGQIYPVDVHHNIFDHTRTDGIPTGALIVLWDHTDSPTRHVANHDIHDNQFWCRGTPGIVPIRCKDQDVSPTGGIPTTNFQLWDMDNHFSDNEYQVLSLSNSYWQWDVGTGFGVTKTWAQWLAFHSGDGPRVLI